MDNENLTEFSVYPNPATENGFVDVTETNGTVELINLSGSVIFTQPLTQQKMAIYTGDLTPGIYMVRVTTNESTSVKKLIKN